MSDCRSVENLLTPYVDGQQAGDEQVRVEEHLAACPACGARVSEERSVRQLLHARAATVAERAPLALRARCARAASETHRTPAVSAIPLWRRPLLAAALLLVLGGLGVLAAGGSTTVFAAELALDHLKCFTFFDPAAPAPSPERLATDLNARYGWRVAIPPGSPAERLRLVGGRRCFSTDGSVAHILYRHDGRPLSLFIVPDSDRTDRRLALAGYEAIIWSESHLTYVVMGSRAGQDLARVAAYFRAALD